MEDSPTALFDSYESDFKEIIRSIQRKVEGGAEVVHGEQRKVELRRAEMELDEADEMVCAFLTVCCSSSVLFVHVRVNARSLGITDGNRNPRDSPIRSALISRSYKGLQDRPLTLQEAFQGRPYTAFPFRALHSPWHRWTDFRRAARLD